MEITIANRQTGAVIQAHCKDGISQLRGVIRDWMKNDGLSMNDFRILSYSHYKLADYIRGYAWEHEINECDVCAAPQLNKDLEWVHDNHEVCIMAVCRAGCGDLECDF